MPQVSIARRVDCPPTVIEFFGLPGAGKTTIANYLADALQARGYHVQTTTDFVRWLSEQSRQRKLGFLISKLHDASRQLFWCVLFSIQMRPLGAISLSKIARVPYLNLCFDRYLDTLGDTIAVMDQANMQLIWSVGAFSSRHNKGLLHHACKAALGAHPRLFACLTPNILETSQRLQSRASNHSRFDALRGVQLGYALGNASRIITDLRTILDQEDQDLVDIDITLPPEENAKRLVSQFLEALPRAVEASESPAQ